MSRLGLALTGRARGALQAALVEATQRGSTLIESVDLLVGLFQPMDSVAARVLVGGGLSPGLVRAMVADGSKRHPEQSGEGSFAPSGLDVLRGSEHEARRSSHNYIGTEHLLLGLLRREGDPVALLVTPHLGSYADTRKQILRLLKRA